MSLDAADSQAGSGAERALRIVHCFRSPIGGLFRHVADLTQEQARNGHSVGIICDSTTGGEYEERLFERLMPSLALGSSDSRGGARCRRPISPRPGG